MGKTTTRQIRIERDAWQSVLVTGDSNIVIFYAAPPLEPEPPKPLPIGPNPYRGLEAFTERDAYQFFGREAPIDRLWNKLKDLYHVSSGQKRPVRVLPILGPSGCGKSSLARAGLIAELARRPLPGYDKARVCVLMPGSHPIEALGMILARIATGDETPVRKTREFNDELLLSTPQGIFDGLRRIADVLPEIERRPLIVLVDQFEEVYSLCDNDYEQSAFIGTLLDAASDPTGRVAVIITLRSDFIGATNRHPALNKVIAEHGVIVPVMSEEELHHAIVQPATQAGHSIDAATANLLVEQTVRREGALPLLQFVLTRIWEGMAKGVTPAETVEKIGGVGGALAGEAQRLYETLSAADKRIARRAFLAMLRLDEGERPTRRRAPVSEIIAQGESPGHVLEVIRVFSRRDNRMITLSASTEGPSTAEITHEALFEHWSQLKMWAETSRNDLRFHRRLAEASAEWDAQDRPTGLLWRPPTLDQLREFHTRSAADMTATEMAFFKASEQDQRMRNRRRTGIFVGSITTAILMAILAFVAWTFWNTAERQSVLYQDQRNEALRAQSLALAALSRAQTDGGNATLGVLLALEALPQNLAKPHRPYVQAAERALQYAAGKQHERLILYGHKSIVYHASFSPDGRWIATASGDNSARIWDATTGDPLSSLEGHSEEVFNATFSPDGQFVLTTSKDGWAGLWYPPTGELKLKLEDPEGKIVSAAFSPNGRWILTGSEHGAARLWLVETGEIKTTLQGHHSGIEGLAFSSDGHLIVTASNDQTARVWDADTGELRTIIQGHTAGLWHAEFSPDGRRILTCSGDQTARLWDAATGEPIAVMKGLDSGKWFFYTRGWERPMGSGVILGAFSPDGSRVVTVSGHCSKVQLWDGATGALKALLEGHEQLVWFAAFSPDGSRLLTASRDNTARLWDARTGEPISVLQGHRDEVYSAIFSPDGKRILTASLDGTARIWDAALSEPAAILKGHKKAVWHATFSPEGRRIVTASSDGTARLWDAETAESIVVLRGHESVVWKAAFSPDGKTVITASKDGTARIWDPANGELLFTLSGNVGSVEEAAFSPDGKRVVTASQPKFRGNRIIARVWDAATGRLLIKLKSADWPGHRPIAAFSPDGNRIVTPWGENYVARVWDAATGEPIASMYDYEGPVFHLAFSPDGKKVVSASSFGRIARVWDAENGRLIANLWGHKDVVCFAAFSPEGERIVTASYDGTARLWKAMDGALIVTLKDHNDKLFQVVFSKDGRYVLSASADGTARVWDADSGEIIRTLKGHYGEVLHAEFSPDGKHIVTASTDGSVRLWNLLPSGQELIDYAKGTVSRTLTERERRRFLADDSRKQ